MMASSSPPVHSRKYDLFISFRGSDVRQGFLSHLYKALLDQKIEAFVDEQLNRGEDISDSLFEKIEESHIAVVVFSQNYAYSEWCLEELLKIAECRNMAGQVVIPVFYGVDPTDVQDLTGSYGHAMAQHRTQFDESLVESWGNVLKDMASLSGLVSSNFMTESQLIQEIIKHALEKLNWLYPSDSDCDDGLVGINSRVEKVMSLLCGSKDVCVVGIWGEGGVGKTTLAHATFDRICSRFDCQCFVANVREKSVKLAANAWQNEVVFKLFGTSASYKTRKRLSRKKVFLVLDDVSDLDQIKSIIRHRVYFGRGSKIIVTSRDSHLLKSLGAEIYAVDELNDLEALQLFCLNVFDDKVPPEGYLKLCEKAVKYAQGLPLALEVLGSNLFQRNAEEWEDELEKLKDKSDQKIHKMLRISYDGLSDDQKEIFLDIACCFKGRRRGEVESMLDVRGSRIGISRLAEKALISISLFSCLNMHDLIQQMAKDIICEEKTARKRRWLWNPEEIYFLLTREMRTEAVRGLLLDTSKTRNINLSPSTFRKLYNLRYLQFYTSSYDDAKICAHQGLDYLPEQLRYLYWDQYPCKSLPSISFCSEKLVELTMCGSQIEKLWDGVQNLPNLKWINLSRSTKLIKVPDLSTASNLEELNLEMCKSLVEIPSLGNLGKLIVLNLSNCSRLKRLPDDICALKSLSRLNISYCQSLHGLPLNFGDLKSLEELLARESGIKELPNSVCSLKACMVLDVSYCKNIRWLPQNFWNLQSLEYLHAEGSGIKEVPCYISNLRALRELSFIGYGGLILPPPIHLWSINLTDCGISEFPIGLCSVTSLIHVNLTRNKFDRIPESIRNLLKLHTLVLNDCKKLKYLPESIKLLPRLSHLEMTECTSLDPNRFSNVIDHLIMSSTEGRRECIARVCYPGSEVVKMMKYKDECGSYLSFSFKLLQHLRKNRLVFYACTVIDRSMHDVTVEGNFIDESGLRFDLEGFKPYGSGFTIHSKHLVLSTISFRSKNFVKGRKYTAEIRFQTTGAIDEDRHCFYPCDGIIKCGVMPLFDHQTIDQFNTSMN